MRLDHVMLEDLEGDQRQLAELIGIEAYRLLAAHHGGTYVYVQAPNSLLRKDRNEQIRRKFDGKNYKELALQYQISESTVRLIVEDDARRMRYGPMEGQIGLFDKKII